MEVLTISGKDVNNWEGEKQNRLSHSIRHSSQHRGTGEARAWNDGAWKCRAQTVQDEMPSKDELLERARSGATVPSPESKQRVPEVDARNNAAAVPLPRRERRLQENTVDDVRLRHPSGATEFFSPRLLPDNVEQVAQGPANARLWCHILLYKLRPDFALIPMLMGQGGRNMRRIYCASRAKIRVRGRGSGHLEGKGTKEADVPLMVAITSHPSDREGFKTAVSMTITELERVSKRFWRSSEIGGLTGSSNRIWKMGGMSRAAARLLKDMPARAKLPVHDIGSTKLYLSDLVVDPGAQNSLCAAEACPPPLCPSPNGSGIQLKDGVGKSGLLNEDAESPPHQPQVGPSTPNKVPPRPILLSQELAAVSSEEECDLQGLIKSQVSAFLQDVEPSSTDVS